MSSLPDELQKHVLPRRPEDERFVAQLRTIVKERGLRLKSIATRMGIDATFLSQLIHRPTSAERIVEIVRALNDIDESGKPPVEPWHFDQYVTLSAGEALKKDPELIDMFRTVLYRMSEPEREAWKRVTAALAPRR